MISFIIQGQLNPVSLGMARLYSKFGEVIVSCWETDNLELVQGMKFIKLVKNPPIRKDVENPQNVYRQVITTLAGLYEAKGRICIKFRSDECFSNPKPLIEAALENQNKVICSNIYFRKSWPLHMSDHVIATNRELFIRAFTYAKDYIEMTKNILFTDIPEIILTHYFLQALDVQIPDYYDYRKPRANTEQEIKMLQDHFHIVPVRRLGYFLIKVHATVNGRLSKVHIDKEDKIVLSHGGLCIFNSVKELSGESVFLKML